MRTTPSSTSSRAACLIPLKADLCYRRRTFVAARSFYLLRCGKFPGNRSGERVGFHPMSGEVERILSGGGDAGALARSVDWSKTAIGPVEGWSQALRSAASLVLHNDSP